MKKQIKTAQTQMKFWTRSAYDQTLTEKQRQEASERAQMWAKQIEKLVNEAVGR